jgi:DNA-directed RNA polymerase specialized sigma subunit
MKNIEDILYEYPTIGQDILKQNKELTEFIKSKDEEYGSLGNYDLNFTPTSSSDGKYDPILETILRFEKHVRYLSNKVNSLIEQKEQTEKMLLILTPQEKRIIELRYFYRLSWYAVSVKAHYCEKQCRRINKEAIIKLNKYIPH